MRTLAKSAAACVFILSSATANASWPPLSIEGTRAGECIRADNSNAPVTLAIHPSSSSSKGAPLIDLNLSGPTLKFDALDDGVAVKKMFPARFPTNTRRSTGTTRNPTATWRAAQ